ncbi:hypothetical protein TRSC58_01801 [Trypanosoma rangeli SC58]|uniref:Uncharacterized protein n=1 Tax=Trypanosoma rangeli SC58 TaxID=429131 RepID=A0A061J8M4_TRYRA|nr:hypothetical protein TRSC58_01801 [Trypanosoma rangeli SC58]
MVSDCRDPVSQLAIVPLEAMEREACEAFRQLLPPPSSTAGDAIPVIFYCARVTRHTRFGRSLPCHLLVSRSHWYLCKPAGRISRCCRIDRIAKVITCRDMYVVWKIEEGRDVVMRLGDANEIAFVANVLRILQASVAGRALPVVEKLAEEHMSLSGADKPQLERRGPEEDACPLPLVSAAEAQQQCTVESVLVMMPPPPSSQPQPRLEFEVGGTQRDARVEAILRYMDDRIENARMPVAPEGAAARVRGSCSNEGATYAEQDAAVMLSPVQPLRAPSTAQSTIRCILPVAEDEPVETQLTLPLPCDFPLDPTPAVVSCRPPPPPPSMPPQCIHLLGEESGEPLEARVALRKLREMEDRITSLERERESEALQRSQVHGDTEAHSPRPPFSEKAKSFRTPSPLPANPFARRTPPPRLSLQQENGCTNTADFERCVAAKSLEERLALRRYEIDLQLHRVSSYIKAGDVQHLPLVTRLQEDLLLLLQAQQTDEEFGTAQRQKSSGVDTAGLRAETTRRGVLGEEDEAGKDNETQEGWFGLDDYDVWAATDEGKEWYNELFGEHLVACKEAMVRNAFTHPTTSL